MIKHTIIVSFSVIFFLIILQFRVHASQLKHNLTEEILVYGKRTNDVLLTISECDIIRCSEEDKARRSLYAAEHLFVVGDYARARDILRGSGRASDELAKSHPQLAAGVQRAISRISAHMGDGDAALRASYRIGRALKIGLPPNDPRIAYARIESADMLLKLGKLELAKRSYSSLLDEGPPVAPIAQLRIAWLDAMTGQKDRARATLTAIASTADPELRPFTTAANVLLLRLMRSDQREAAVEKLIRSYRENRVANESLTLLWSPSVDLGGRTRVPDDFADRENSLVAGINVANTWADVGFRVTQEGGVRDAEILRSRGSGWWHSAVLSALSGRKYAPFSSKNPEGEYRVERVTLTAWLTPVVGSRIERRSSRLRLEFLDLTADGTPETSE